MTETDQPSNGLEWARSFLAARAHAEHADLHKSYLKSSMDFLGLRKPAINELGRLLLQRHPLPRTGAAAALMAMTEPLFNSTCFEERSLAIVILGRGQRHLGYEEFRQTLFHWPDEVDNWAHLDEFCTKVVGAMALREPRIFEDTAAWVQSPHMWTRRASLLLYIPRIRKQDAFPAGLEERCQMLVKEKEFFIRKAMGWVLRELSRKDTQSLREIFLAICGEASGLTVREALRKLPEAQRRELMSWREERLGRLL